MGRRTPGIAPARPSGGPGGGRDDRLALARRRQPATVAGGFRGKPVAVWRAGGGARAWIRWLLGMAFNLLG